MRRLKKAQAEFKLVCLALNLRQTGPCRPVEQQVAQNTHIWRVVWS